MELCFLFLVVTFILSGIFTKVVLGLPISVGLFAWCVSLFAMTMWIMSTTDPSGHLALLAAWFALGIGLATSGFIAFLELLIKVYFS
jgi:hypothetical protein